MSVSVLAEPGRVTRDGIAEWHFPSASEPGTVHVATRHIDGSWDCTCRGFRCGRRMDGLCLHLDESMAADRPLTLADVLG